ncbi:MAG: ATP-binding cassette domain-containing protein [Bacilli bacterium]|nr:ATP-binding cassette domain-containing protein [Bacilli bacterium]
MLEVENLVKYYGDLRALNNLSFKVDEGEIFGLLGLNGSGKTTTFRIIMGLLEQTSGKVTLNGKKIDYSITDKIGFLPEERSLLTKLTVLEQVIFYGRLKGLKEEDIEKKLDYYLEKFGILEYKNKKIKELSKGNQQKIQFITSIINNPKLLILDEPFSGLDPINIELFKKEILELASKGSIIIFSSHRMDHVELFCKKIVVLVKGENVLSGNLLDIKEKYKKKNIIVRGNIDIEDVKKIDGVIDISFNDIEYKIKVTDIDITKKVFDKIKKYDITKYVIEEASLEEIFIDKVGVAYEK